MRLTWLALASVLAAACSAVAGSAIEPYQCAVTPLPLPDRRLIDLSVFGGEPSDPIADHHVLIAGHSGPGGKDPLWVLRDNRWQSTQAFLPFQSDRHGCIPLNVSGAPAIEFLCLAGGGRGSASGNPNALYRSTDAVGDSNHGSSSDPNDPSSDSKRDSNGDPNRGSAKYPGRFERTPLPEWLSVPTARSRLGLAFNPPGDGQHLVLAVWGERRDGAPNETLLVKRVGGTFEPLKVLPGRPGGRCGVTGDFNGDGVADFALCHEAGGATAWLSEGGDSYQPVALTQKWVQDLVVASGDTGSARLWVLGTDWIEAVTLSCGAKAGTGPGEITSRRESIDDGGSADPEQTCSPRTLLRLPLVPDDDAIAWSLAVTDLTGDGERDLFVVFGTPQRARGDRSDRLFLGPDYNRSYTVPAAPRGLGYQVEGVADGVLRASGGPDWEGPLEWITCPLLH